MLKQSQCLQASGYALLWPKSALRRILRSLAWNLLHLSLSYVKQGRREWFQLVHRRTSKGCSARTNARGTSHANLDNFASLVWPIYKWWVTIDQMKSLEKLKLFLSFSFLRTCQAFDRDSVASLRIWAPYHILKVCPVSILTAVTIGKWLIDVSLNQADWQGAALIQLNLQLFC